jgi:hypothetical protein
MLLNQWVSTHFSSMATQYPLSKKQTNKSPSTPLQKEKTWVHHMPVETCI